MIYPHYGKELLTLLETDQHEVRSYSRTYRRAPNATTTHDLREQLTLHSQHRAKRALEILDEIGVPTAANIGTDGSQAISVLALHASLSAMKRVLSAFEASYANDPASVYREAIPSLTDRILVIERKKQRFGTQWMLGADGNFFLPPVEDFAHLNQRRATHGLAKSKHPISLTDGIPGSPAPRMDTRETDQRPPTEREYQDFAYGALA